MKSFLITLLTLMCCSFAFAALSDYSFTQSAGEFVPITNSTTIHATDIDDAMSAVINIGFNFMYDEVGYTQFKANSNGFITLNPASTAGLSNALATQILIIGGMWDDLRTDATNAHVAYELSGTAPNRVLTVEYKNLRWYYSIATNLINFQIKLFEGSNKIEYIYGTMGTAPGVSASASIGLSGATAGNYLSITPASPTATYSSTAEFTAINATHVPFLTGFKYTFLPPVPANNDLAAVGLIGNTTPSQGTQTNYTVSLYNRGTNPQSTYTVQLIDAQNIVLSTTPGTAIAAGQSIQVQVPWTPATTGPVSLRAKVVLVGDENPANDISPVLNVSVMPQGVIAVTVGDGSQTARMPIDMFYRNSLYQNIYYANEIGMVGNINTITLYNQFTTTTLQNKPTKIWMGITDQNDLTAGWIPGTQMTLVFDGTVNYPAGTNDIVIPLQNIFSYTGGNLVVTFNRPMDTAYFSSLDFFKCQTVGTNRARNIFSDSVVYEPNTVTGGTLTGQFPKTTFMMTPLGTDPYFLVTPTSKNYGTMLINTTANQTFTITNGGGGTLTISSITIAGAPHFSLQNLPTLPVNLTTGQTTTFVGRYNPTVEGAHTATITIMDNTTRIPRTVQLTGNCIDTTINNLPYSQNFDAVTAPALPIDWTAIVQSSTTAAYVRTLASAPQSAPNCAVLFNSTDLDGQLLLVAPPLATTLPTNTVRVKFWAKAGGTNYSLSVGVLSDPLDPTTYTEVQSITMTTTTWTEFSVPLTPYAGTGRYIAFRHPHGGSGRTINVDTVTFEVIAANDLAATAIIGNSTPSVNAVSQYTITIFNNGTSAQSNYQVKLFKTGDVELGSVAGPAINAGATQTVAIPWTPSAQENTALYGKVILAGDVNPTNDQTPNLNVFVQPAGLVFITVGDGSQQARMPIDMYWKNSLFQGIFYPADLGNTLGQITGLQFFNNFITNLPNKPTKVWIGTTTQTSMEAGWIPSTQLTLVYDGTINYPSGQNTIMIPFSQPFLYLNGENIVIMVNRPMDTQYFNASDNFYAQTDGTARSRRVQSDTTDYDPAAPPATSTLSGQFPKTTFVMIPGGVGHLNGTVLGAGGQPLAGVAVDFATGGYSATTNAQGQFSIQNILPGNYQITYSRYGYLPQTHNTPIMEDQTGNVEVNMVQMPTVTVSGTIIASNTGNGISGAGISLTGYENYTASTNTQGQFSIAMVYASQTYEYAIIAPGYQNASGTINIGTTNYSMGNITLNEVAYAPRSVQAEIVNNNTAVDLTWLAPDPNALNITQSFEDALFPPADWSRTITNTGAAGTNGVFPTWCRFGSVTVNANTVAPSEGAWQAGLWWSYEHQDEWLITPQFNCPPSAFLRFDSYVYYGSTNGDHYYVKISTDNGANWTVLWDASTQTGGWNQYQAPITLDLSSYEGLSIKLAWHAVDPPTNDGLWYVWIIDNVYVGNEATSMLFDFDQMSVKSSKPSSLHAKMPSVDHGNINHASKAMQQGLVRSELTMPDAPHTQNERVVGYRAFRLTSGNESNENAWVALTPNPITELNFTDSAWATLANGTYKWAIKAVYTNNVLSVATFSNHLVKQVVNGTIAGVVRTTSNQPIPGATITAGAYSATTNAVGAYNILLPIGTYDVTASRTGYISQTIQNVNVNANQTTTVNFAMVAGSDNDDHIIPVVATELKGNYPNPFNPSTTIGYDIKDHSHVRLEIYNIKGQLIRTLVNKEQNNGRYTIVWNGTDDLNRPVSSGVYFYKMQAGDYSLTRKMLLME